MEAAKEIYNEEDCDIVSAATEYEIIAKSLKTSKIRLIWYLKLP
ncbi:MAG: hypothetical protein ACK5KR_05010 [Breznakia sp.]